jgi:hypothetical protein
MTTSIPIYLCIARTGGSEQEAGEAGALAVTGTNETANALGVLDLPPLAGLSRWETRQAIAAVLHEHGWRVAGKWDDCLGDVAWAVTVERVVTCIHCGTEIWWRIPLRFSGRSDVVGGWVDTDLDDFCDTRGGGAPHEPRTTAEG